jgi:hypothetical protein
MMGESSCCLKQSSERHFVICYPSYGLSFSEQVVYVLRVYVSNVGLVTGFSFLMRTFSLYECPEDNFKLDTNASFETFAYSDFMVMPLDTVNSVV